MMVAVDAVGGFDGGADFFAQALGGAQQAGRQTRVDRDFRQSFQRVRHAAPLADRLKMEQAFGKETARRVRLPLPLPRFAQAPQRVA